MRRSIFGKVVVCVTILAICVLMVDAQAVSGSSIYNIAYYNGSWPNNPGYGAFGRIVYPGYNYDALVAETFRSDALYAIRDDGGIDNIVYYNGSWPDYPGYGALVRISPYGYTYDAIAADYKVNYSVYGIRSTDGGIDTLVYYNGSWPNNPGYGAFLRISKAGDSYDKLVADPVKANNVFAIRSDNGHINQILYYNGNWPGQGGTGFADIGRAGTSYIDLAADFKVALNHAGDEYIIYAIRANDGHIDRLYYSGGWQAQDVTPSGYSYVALVADPWSKNSVYAIRANDGGIDNVRYYGGWIRAGISAPGSSYVALAADATVSDSVYALRTSDGGIDHIKYYNGWPAAGDGYLTSIAPAGTSYVTFAVDNFNDNSVYGIMANRPPVAVCKDITVYLDANGQATIIANDVNNGSSDPDGDPIALSIDINTFDCDDVVTPVTVTLTVSDGELTDTCEAEVTVVDNIAPVVAGCALVPADGPGRSVNNMPNVSANFREVDLSNVTATDNCGVESVSAAIDGIEVADGNKVKISIDPTQPTGKVSGGPKDYIHIIGPTGELTVTATDVNGNVVICTATP